MDDTDQLLPLCFVLMPFGKKMDAAGRVTNFDAVYARIIAPAVEHSGLEPIRADEEKIGGTIHKPMFERLMLCHYAVADITGANPNVFYELGIRHAMRPRSTVIVFAEGTVLPFDIALVCGIAYKTDGAGEPVDAETTLRQIADQLQSARGNPLDDSPIFQLVEGVPRWEIDHSRTDIFRKAVDYSKRYKDRLRAAVKEGADSVKKVADDPALSNLIEKRLLAPEAGSQAYQDYLASDSCRLLDKLNARAVDALLDEAAISTPASVMAALRQVTQAALAQIDRIDRSARFRSNEDRTLMLAGYYCFVADAILSQLPPERQQSITLAAFGETVPCKDAGRTG